MWYEQCQLARKMPGIAIGITPQSNAGHQNEGYAPRKGKISVRYLLCVNDFNRLREREGNASLLQTKLLLKSVGVQ